jgi:hypothetical protein
MSSPENIKPQGTWVPRYLTLMLADGSILMKPQKPELRSTAKQTAKMTGVSQKTLARLAESGFIRCAPVTPGSGLRLYYPAEVEAFIKTVEEDPDFWTPARCAQYGLARKKV